MSGEGLMQFNTARSGYENALGLLENRQWEDALACLVLEGELEETMGWVLQRFTTGAEPLSDLAQLCANDISQWLNSHDETLRWRIFQQAETLGFDTPLGALGLSVFWMRGSMTPTEFDAVYPEPHLAPLMVHCALKLLSVALAGDNAPYIGAQTLLTEWFAVKGLH
ncbi:hypothetical protein I6H07_22975 (plasmid) [Hafnia alvei]|uniref:DUF6931 family protein n=1 Tax=Hafnia alvei TaxID=569 RepID=UPI000B73AB1B|nr:hypothetical protein [Hafnia alvei]MBI0278600.1 hypothetical protein [Hafnia alvei]PNL03895.1 hypothetical protein CEQ28_000365 [Hafnia alvei]